MLVFLSLLSPSKGRMKHFRSDVSNSSVMTPSNKMPSSLQQQLLWNGTLTSSVHPQRSSSHAHTGLIRGNLLHVFGGVPALQLGVYRYIRQDTGGYETELDLHAAKTVQRTESADNTILTATVSYFHHRWLVSSPEVKLSTSNVSQIEGLELYGAAGKILSINCPWNKIKNKKITFWCVKSLLKKYLHVLQVFFLYSGLIISQRLFRNGFWKLRIFGFNQESTFRKQNRRITKNGRQNQQLLVS